MRSSILIVMGALVFGCGGKQNDAQTTPTETTNPSGAEGASPPPMAGEEMQGQEMPNQDDMQGQGTEGTEGTEGQGTQDPNLQSQSMQGQGMQGMQGQDMQGQDMQGQGMQGMHAGHAQAGGAQAGMGGEHDMAASCPMAVPGTTARTENVSGGVAIVFTTKTGDVADLQRRVALMADMHNQHHATSSQQGQQGAQAQQGAQGQQGAQAQQGAQGQVMIPAQARAENTARGARLVLIAQSPKQLKQMRQQIRQHAQQMASSGQCAMMEHQSGMETPAQRNNRQATTQPPQP